MDNLQWMLIMYTNSILVLHHIKFSFHLKRRMKWLQTDGLTIEQASQRIKIVDYFIAQGFIAMYNVSLQAH